MKKLEEPKRKHRQNQKLPTLLPSQLLHPSRANVRHDGHSPTKENMYILTAPTQIYPNARKKQYAGHRVFGEGGVGGGIFVHQEINWELQPKRFHAERPWTGALK